MPGIDGYTFYFHRNRVGRRGGGVALYVRNTLNCCRHYKKTERNTESLWIDIIIGRKKFVVGIIYRPPDLKKSS